MNFKLRKYLTMVNSSLIQNKILRFTYLTLITLAFSFPSQAQNFEWAKKMGGTFVDMGESIVTDDLCNVYSTGYFYPPGIFDDGILATVGSNGQGPSAFVQKRDPNGNFIWVVNLHGNGNYDQVIGKSITVDNAGFIYIVGHFRGTIDFNPHPTNTFNLTSTTPPLLQYHSNTFILKLDPAGNFIWAKKFEAAQVSTIKADASGNIYIAGNFNGTRNFDPGASNTIVQSSGANKFYRVTKLSRYCL